MTRVGESVPSRGGVAVATVRCFSPSRLPSDGVSIRPARGTSSTEEPDFAAITPHGIREPQSRRWIDNRYGSVERWLLLARVALDDAIAHGTFRAQDRAAILDFHAGLVAGR